MQNLLGSTWGSNASFDHTSRFLEEAQTWMDFTLSRLHLLTLSWDIICYTRFSDSYRPKIITVMWTIWSLRNSCAHCRGSYDPIQSPKMVKESLEVLEVPKKYFAILPGHGWAPPNTIKINTEGAYLWIHVEEEQVVWRVHPMKRLLISSKP